MLGVPLLNLLALSLSPVHCVQLLSAIRRDVHLLRIIDRDWCRIPPQITHCAKCALESPLITISHLRGMLAYLLSFNKFKLNTNLDNSS